ncbi:unnamed protein product [Linum trigynum]|uniref:Uncharacterized protein n=1 Tax=Linum trigynum TaxID=586398 RepID=A0AAV2FCD0_9ROSI
MDCACNFPTDARRRYQDPDRKGLTIMIYRNFIWYLPDRPDSDFNEGRAPGIPVDIDELTEKITDGLEELSTLKMERDSICQNPSHILERYDVATIFRVPEGESNSKIAEPNVAELLNVSSFGWTRAN